MYKPYAKDIQAGIYGDPHIVDPHGGHYDFRGEDRALYTFHSSQNLTLNVMTEDADFELHNDAHPRHKHVHGSFLTQAHIVARTWTGRLVNLSFYADVISEDSFAVVNGSIDGVRVAIGPNFQKTVDEVKIWTNYSSLHVQNPEFEIRILPINLRPDYMGRGQPELNSTVHHRLDVQLKMRVAEKQLSVAPHGIVGQGWDGDGLAIDGEEDIYPESGEFMTYAFAFGAIEGVPDDYMVDTLYSTDFKYSRFDKTKAAPRDVEKLVASGHLNKPKQAPFRSEFAQDFIGSTERKHNLEL
jgi:hypothetical protein